MRAISGQYANEIVSLTVLALMAIALIAGQAGAIVPGTAASHADHRAPADVIEAVAEAAILHADFEIDVDFATIAQLVRTDLKTGTPPAAIRIRFDSDK